MKFLLIILFCAASFLSAQDIKTIVTDCDHDLLVGKNMLIAICKVESPTVSKPFKDYALNGMIPWGRKSAFLLKNRVMAHEIIYVSPSVAFDLHGSHHRLKDNVSFKELWTEAHEVGGNLELHNSFEKSDENLVIAESLKVGGEYVLVVRQILPATEKLNLIEAIESRKISDKRLIESFNGFLEKRAK